MYSNNFVVAVKVKGKILRELNEVVYLPFGSEYTLLLKNKSNLRAKANVEIDGQSVTDGDFVVLNAGESLELKRFIRNGNLSSGNAFKFIEKTQKIEQYRGNKVDDGLVTVRYEFASPVVFFHQYLPGQCIPNDPWKYLVGRSLHGQGYNGLTSNTVYTNNSSFCSVQGADSLIGGTLTTTSITSGNTGKEEKLSSNILRSKSINDAGITAPGSEVKQEFVNVADFATDGVKHSITLMLKGAVETLNTAGNLHVTGKIRVQKPVVVQKVQRCTMCGTNTRQTAKFCHECGASVHIL